MARNNFLQVGQNTQILSGGYGRGANGAPLYSCGGGNCQTGTCNMVEEIDGSCTAIDYSTYWRDFDDAGTLSRTYTWRDAGSARNSSSARGNVEIIDSWTSEIDGSNNLIVHLTSTLTKVWRDDIRSGTYGSRTIAILEGGDYPTTQASSHLIANLGSVNIATFQNASNPWVVNVSRSTTIVIPPQQSSMNTRLFRVKNWVSNATNINGAPSMFVDEMTMGTVFKNNLPNQFDPPELIRIDQTPQICDNVVDAALCFKAPNLNGAKLVVQWHYEGQDWTTLKQVESLEAHRDDEEVCVTIKGLIPTTCPPPTKVYWRAQFVPLISTLLPSEWTYGEFETVFVPPVWMNVPDITTPECNAVGKGDLLDQFEEIVYYNGKRPECKKGDC